MKNLICFIFALSLFSAFILSAQAYVECDGNIEMNEWSDSERIILFEGREASDTIYRSLSVRYIYSKPDKRICVSVTAESKDRQHTIFDERNLTELYLSFNDSTDITIRTDGTLACNQDEFFVRHGAIANQFGGAGFEADIVLKELRLNGPISMFVQVKDCNGVLSPEYEIIISDKPEETTDGKITAEKPAAGRTEKRTKKITSTQTETKATERDSETVIVTEEYESFSQTLETNNRILLGIGAFCVLSALAVMFFVMFRKKGKHR